jgi:hypothetical protein
LQQIIAKQTEVAQINELAKKKNWTVIEAITQYRKFIKGNGYSPRTLETYKGYLDDIEEAFTDTPLAALYAKDLTEYDVAPLIENMFQENEWQTRTYNNYIGFTGTLFNKCSKLERAADRTVKY